MGLFDRNPGKDTEKSPEKSTGTPGAPSGGDPAVAAGGVDHSDDDLFDAIDEVDGIDVPEATRPLSVPTGSAGRVEQGEPVAPATPAGPAPSADGVVDGAGGADGAEPASPESSDTPEPPAAADAKPKRDIYSMSGRARPQRIEPRAAEPARAAAGTDGDRTEVFGAASADPAYTGTDDDHETRAFDSSVGASGGAAYATQDRADTGDAPAPVGRGAVRDDQETTAFAAGTTATVPASSDWSQPVGPDQSLPSGDDRTVVSPDDPEAVDGAAAPVASSDAVDTDPKRGTLDFGLFVLRVVVGALLLVRGLQTLFAFGGDPGISAFEQVLGAYTAADILAVAVPVAQIVAGGLLVFGLLTPVGSALAVVVAGFLALHNLSIWDSGYWPYTLSPQVQFWGLLGLVALTLTFTGPGRYSADASRGWATRPLASAWLFAVIGLAGAAGLWLAVGGGNPF
ncbi:DoxX family membrane protein [Corynebacterium sp.]|uniref:DoxX family membrane protein n=1 Tax=Corynebacterium sp. TaxID=1720 RepID=UPI003B3BDE6F